MDIEKHLILIKGDDRTEAIRRCIYEKGKWQVEFAQGKVYTYNYPNVQWLKNPISLDSATSIAYQNNQPLSGMAKILNFGDLIRIWARASSLASAEFAGWISTVS